jgi:hypothetical protein
MEEMIRESTQAVWEGCPINCLHAGIIIMKICNLYGVPHTFLDELLTFLLTRLLPRGNNLPRNAYETKRTVMKMGLEHVQIHCFPYGHILYKGDGNEDLTESGMSKWTSYGKNYRPDVRPRLRLPCGWVFTVRGRGKNRVCADARGHASRGHGPAWTRF